jgi:ABC-type multidrug transport system fused ATPase/permease subunit
LISKIKLFFKIIIDFFHLLEKKDKQSFILFLALSIVNTVLELFSLYLLVNLLFVIADLNQTSSKFLDIVNIFINENPILISTYLILATVIIKFIFQIIYSYKQEKFGYSIQKKISQKVFLKILNVDYLDYLKLSSSKITRILNTDLIRINNQLISPLVSTLNESLLIFSISLVIFYYDPYLGISILFFAIIVISFFMLSINKQVKRNSKEGIKFSTFLIKHILESHKSFIALNFYGVKNNFIKKFDEISTLYTHYGYKTIFLIRLPKNIFELLVFISLSSLILILYSLQRVDLIIQYVGILSLATFKIIPSLNKLSVSLQAIQYFSNPFYEILNLLAVSDNTRKTKNEIQDFKKIEYQNLNYSYDGKKNILNKSDLIIKKNDFIGIKGESGSGKSTLINLISGLLKSNSTKIKVDNSICNPEDLRNIFSIVQQETNIIDQTLYENIGLDFNISTSNKITIDAILKKVNLYEDFITKKEENLGENGNKISGGQKQRIGIARGLYFNKKILILDESTSNLDEENQLGIIELLKRVIK